MKKYKLYRIPDFETIHSFFAKDMQEAIDRIESLPKYTKLPNEKNYNLFIDYNQVVYTLQELK